MNPYLIFIKSELLFHYESFKDWRKNPSIPLLSYYTKGPGGLTLHFYHKTISVLRLPCFLSVTVTEGLGWNKK